MQESQSLSIRDPSQINLRMTHDLKRDTTLRQTNMSSQNNPVLEPSLSEDSNSVIHEAPDGEE